MISLVVALPSDAATFEVELLVDPDFLDEDGDPEKVIAEVNSISASSFKDDRRLLE